MFNKYHTSNPQFHQFKSTFHDLIKEAKEVLINYNPSLAEDFERNAESFLQIIDSVNEMKHLKKL